MLSPCRPPLRCVDKSMCSQKHDRVSPYFFSRIWLKRTNLQMQAKKFVLGKKINLVNKTMTKFSIICCISYNKRVIEPLSVY